MVDDESPAPVVPPKRRRKLRKKRVALTLLPLLILIATGLGGWYWTTRDTSPIPKSLRQKVSFPLYYPDPKKLPNGYMLDASSFTYSEGAVLYAINYGNKKQIIVSAQAKPSDGSVIQNFNTHSLALHFTDNTSIGTATIGAINKQTIASLPADSKTWLIITAPSDINQNQFKQVLQSLKN